MKPFVEGEVVRDPDGRLRFRARKGTVAVDFGDGTVETTTSTSFTELATPHYLTDEEAWKIFDDAARLHLNMSGKKFLRKWDAGDYPDPDAEEGVMSVAMLIPLVRPRVPEQ